MHFYATLQFHAGEKVFEGFGNPDAWILIIGNEPEFDKMENRITGPAAKKYQRFFDHLSLRKRAPGYEFYNRIFFTDIRQIIGQEIWLTEPELIKTYFAKDFGNFFSSEFVMQFPIVIISLEDEMWNYGMDIAKLMNVVKKGNMIESFDGRQWYNLFERESSPEPQLVIHTRQISHPDTNLEFKHMVTGALYAYCIKSGIFIHAPSRHGTPDIPKQALDFGDFITEIMDAANAPADNKPIVKCRRKRCKGTLVITLNPDKSISYHCTHCDKSSGHIISGGNP